VKPGQLFLYYDPLDQLSETMRRRWANPTEQNIMVELALRRAKEHAR
jgi:lysine 2,3-aminomutase